VPDGLGKVPLIYTKDGAVTLDASILRGVKAAEAEGQAQPVAAAPADAGKGAKQDQDE
jgi:hypothetical protein